MSDLMLELAVWVESLKADLARALRAERGQGMVEYGLILALVAIAAVVVLVAVGGQLRTVFNDILTKLGGTAVPTPAP